MTVTGEPGQILCAAGVLQRIVVLEVGLERHRVRDLPAPEQVQHGGVNAAVHRQEEVFRLQEDGDQMDGFVVDEKRPEKRPLGFRVVRWRPVFLDLLLGATIAHPGPLLRLDQPREFLDTLPISH